MPLPGLPYMILLWWEAECPTRESEALGNAREWQSFRAEGDLVLEQVTLKTTRP